MDSTRIKSYCLFYLALVHTKFFIWNNVTVEQQPVILSRTQPDRRPQKIMRSLTNMTALSLLLLAAAGTWGLYVIILLTVLLLPVENPILIAFSA